MSVTYAPTVSLIIAASLASTIGGLPFNTLPVLLGSLADTFTLPSAEIGFLGSVCFSGYLLGTLGAPLWLNRINWRWLTVICATGTASAFAFSAEVQALQALYITWAVIGFFASTMTCLGMRILADLHNKERAFGIRQGVELSITAGALFALPPLIIANFGYQGAAWALAGLVVLLGLSAIWVPPHSTVSSGQVTGMRFNMPAASWWALGVFWIFLVGNIGLWTFLERIGVALQVSPPEMGVVFAVLKLLGGVAAFSVAYVGSTVRTHQAYWLSLAGILIGVILLAVASGFGTYAAGAWIWEFAFTCGCVFQTAHIARTDTTGRAIVLVPASFALASMIGPSLAGSLMRGDDYSLVLALTLITSFIPVMAMWIRPIKKSE
jgi:predicted MFS family arabinose efflux permease